MARRSCNRRRLRKRHVTPKVGRGAACVRVPVASGGRAVDAGANGPHPERAEPRGKGPAAAYAPVSHGAAERESRSPWELFGRIVIPVAAVATIIHLLVVPVARELWRLLHDLPPPWVGLGP